METPNQQTERESPAQPSASEPPSAPDADAPLRARLDALYTPLETAVAELQDRRRRFAGRTPGRDWLPADLPGHPCGCAFLSRFFATPNYETRRFLDLARECGLPPVIEEYHGDKFVAHNPIKRALARLGFHTGHDRHGRPLVEFANILDWGQQGRPMREVVTRWDQPLLDFHRELLATALDGEPRPFLYECAPQYARTGGTPEAYYRAFLRVCVADGILFEDFLLDKRERPFTRDVVLPAFDAVLAETRLKPLIVRLTPPEEQTAPHWFWYPGELKTLVQWKRRGLLAERSDCGLRNANCGKEAGVKVFL